MMLAYPQVHPNYCIRKPAAAAGDKMKSASLISEKNSPTTHLFSANRKEPLKYIFIKNDMQSVSGFVLEHVCQYVLAAIANISDPTF